MKIDQTVLELLACPLCNNSLRQEQQELLCYCCKMLYPIDDGIIVLLPEKARKIS